MRVVWSPEAQNDLREIYLFILQDSPYAARSLQALIKERVEHLRGNPYVGRPGRVPGTRELVISGTRYIVPYRVNRGYSAHPPCLPCSAAVARRFCLSVCQTRMVHQRSWTIRYWWGFLGAGSR
ncbi:MAG: type II toxin-antitoxin system RelE/ParE family toxin [Gammaproteobacteria bacterium]